MRVGMGYGYSSLSGSGSGDAAEIRGASLLWHFAIGASLRERLALHAGYFGSTAADPTMSVTQRQYQNGREYTIQSEYDSMVKGSTSSFGAGLTYHTLSNWYLGGQLGIGFIGHSTLSNNHTEATKLGFAADLLLGKEWLVAKNLGVGLAAQCDLVRARDEHADLVWTSVRTGLLFSLTIN